MLIKNRAILFVVLVLQLISLIECAETAVFVQCDPTKASSEKSNNECPENSQCVELGKNQSTSNSYRGLCICKTNYTVNKNYTSSNNTSMYCILITSSVKPTTIIPTTSAPTSRTLIPPTSNNTVYTPSQPSITKKLLHEPQANTVVSDENSNASLQNHHVFGGVVLPLIMVLAFIGAVYGIKKYDLLEHAHNYIRNRREGSRSHQTRYDGLENDFDDDPLLI